MALEEIKTLKEVTHLPAEGNVQVGWQIDIVRDGETISSVVHYELFSAAQKDDFIAKVEGAEVYLAALGWQE